MRTRPGGMLGFSVVWVGQVVSLLGTGMTQFALTIWAWHVTGEATALANRSLTGLLALYFALNLVLSFRGT